MVQYLQHTVGHYPAGTGLLVWRGYSELRNISASSNRNHLRPNSPGNLSKTTCTLFRGTKSAELMFMDDRHRRKRRERMPSIYGHHTYGMDSILTRLESDGECTGHAWSAMCSRYLCVPEFWRVLLAECGVIFSKISSIIWY
ncbi:hypothetical protein TNCV_3857041 [Trichonephila clavipes]|nr:hypothetical protein TNCV_3857041 [Trichonephila clavipes]